MLQVQILSPNSTADQAKKRPSPKIKRFLSSKSIEDQITVMVSFSAEFWDLFVLTATFSSDHPDAYSQWRDR